MTMNLFGKPVFTWRGVPIVPCDKLEVKSRNHTNPWFGTTSICCFALARPIKGWLDCIKRGSG